MLPYAGAAEQQQQPPGPMHEADTGDATYVDEDGFDGGPHYEDMGDDQMYSSDAGVEGDGADVEEQEEEYNVSGMGGL